MNQLPGCLAFCAILPLVLSAQGEPGRVPLNKVRAHGVELHYLDQGAGVPVIFVPGGLEDYRSWQTQVEAFSQGHRAIAYSRRYNFPNTGAASESHYSASVDAEDLAGLIRRLKLAPAHVVGLSYGAYAALLLAVKHPELVRSLVLSEPPVLRWLPRLDGGQPLFLAFMNKVWKPAARGFRQGDEAGLKATVDGFGELGYSGTDEKMTYASLPPEARLALLQNAPEWRALTRSKDAFPSVPFSAVKRLRMPTLLLSGARTLQLAKVIDARLQALLPRGQRIIIPDATHDMWSEKPDQCRKAALEFIDAH